jgi:hypothetical protein
MAVVEVTQETRLYRSFCVDAKAYQDLEKEYEKSALKIYFIMPVIVKKESQCQGTA